MSPETSYQIAACFGLASASMGLASALIYRHKLVRAERTAAFYKDLHDSNEDAFEIAHDTQMCGGCGHYLSPEQIEACPGETCPHYKASLPDLFEAAKASEQKKINTGYIGDLSSLK